MNTNTTEPAKAVSSTDLLGWIDASVEKPKTGRKVIVCGQFKNGNRWRAMAAWYPARTLDATTWDESPDGWWDEDGDICSCPDAAWWETSVEIEEMCQLENVTHWMPLPSMPNTQAHLTAKKG